MEKISEAVPIVIKLDINQQEINELLEKSIETSKYLYGDKGYDKIEIIQEARHKLSEFSGDEWRTGWSVKMYHKGEVENKKFFNRMNDALLWAQNPNLFDDFPSFNLEKRDNMCFQPSCNNIAIIEYELINEYSDLGLLLDKSDLFGNDKKFRRFCKFHSDRGDYSREDCNKNYKEVPYENTYFNDQKE